MVSSRLVDLFLPRASVSLEVGGLEMELRLFLEMSSPLKSDNVGLGKLNLFNVDKSSLVQASS